MLADKLYMTLGPPSSFRFLHASFLGKLVFKVLFCCVDNLRLRQHKEAELGLFRFWFASEH